MAVKTNGVMDDTLPEELIKVLLSLASNWGDVLDLNTLKVKHLTGAMTNEVYRISWPTTKENDTRTVLVRIYGEGVELFFNRDEEIRIFEHISMHGYGPRLLGQFPEGRVEEFIHARDYEYASYNPVAYDLANHFCEMAANYHTETPHILDYSVYPGTEERHRFIRSYLTSAGHQPSDTEVEQLGDEAEKYTLANHLFWGLWGIISAYVNSIDFDYAGYARQRFQQYWLRKPEILGISSDSLCANGSESAESTT